MNKNVSWYV